MTDHPTPTKPRIHRLPLTIAAVLVGAAVGYGSFTLWKRPAPATGPCAPAVDLARKVTPFIKGEVAALTPASVALQLPDLSFEDAGGAAKKLSDFRGRIVLLNLWATWCVPCRKEMPALNELQRKLGGPGFEVVAVNIDTRDGDKPKAFLADAKLDALGYFTDKSARVFQDLKGVGRALGMPTSVLIDPRGCEIATIAGPAEWDSGDALALIDAAMANTP